MVELIVMRLTSLPNILTPGMMQQPDQHWQGLIALADLTRLVDMLVRPAQRQLSLSLKNHYYQDASQAFHYLSGTLQASLPLRCQRCWQLMDYPLNIDRQWRMALAWDELSAIQPPYEPLYLLEGQLSLLDFVSQEVNLALPIVPKHTYACAMLEEWVI